jgi:lipopolysaccharide/colanic/teichoic acid biosynthesis glycosyltransferase
MKKNRKSLYEILKLIFDYLFSIVGLIILLPVILILAVAIKFSTDGPVIYSQKRIGKNGRPFHIYKFRSMNCTDEEGTELISGKDDIRINKVGRFMRKHKLDEIPNLINVLKGEMSFTGPRPEQRHFIEMIIIRNPEYKLLHKIKPGITSWGIVKFGYASNIKEITQRMEYDLYYMKNRSLLFDLKIILKTISIIMKGKGI